MNEIWAPVPGLPGFEVSQSAKVRRLISLGHAMRALDEPRPVPIRMGHNGYPKFTCVKSGKRGTMDLHRAIGLAFLGPPPSDRHHVDHLDQNRANCVLSNLAWRSPSENSRNRRKFNRSQEFKHLVRWARIIDGKSYGQIAVEFGIDHRVARRYAASPA